VIAYVILGTNDLPSAKRFYDALFEEIGASCLKQVGDVGYVWGSGWDKPTLGVRTPYNGKPASVGNGHMVAIGLGSKDQVNRVHAKALALGAKDEGAAGPREGFYAGYFRDLDGNKLSLFFGG
jgi:catechol 2,3-dioxygenase-like lactoylglutathione lyase family enzyme